MSYLLNSTSKKANHPKNVKIKLKDHQLAMLNKCYQIENKYNYGIMKDKPGSGKTFVVLSLIYESIFGQHNIKHLKNNNINNLDSLSNLENDFSSVENTNIDHFSSFNNTDDSTNDSTNDLNFTNLINDSNDSNNSNIYSMNTNIIVVPQNIYTQWILSIENFSNDLSYCKFINYDNIIALYNDTSILNNMNIILTTSLYYHTISTILNTLNIKINRIFFDEIDNISSFIQTKINTHFVWFVSASFNYNQLGIYSFDNYP